MSKRLDKQISDRLNELRVPSVKQGAWDPAMLGLFMSGECALLTVDEGDEIMLRLVPVDPQGQLPLL